MGSLHLFYAICAAAATSAAAFTPPNLAPPSPSVRTGRNSGDKRSVLWSGAIDDFDDFADFSSTQLAQSDDKRGGGVAGGDDPFLSSLQSRLKQVQERSDSLVSVPSSSYQHVLYIIMSSGAHAQGKNSLECPTSLTERQFSSVYASACTTPRSP